jgi:hypothetical protein
MNDPEKLIPQPGGYQKVKSFEVAEAALGPLAGTPR